MPRPKKPGSGEPKTRSRHGCWPCKHRKIKCGEEKPGCLNCERNGDKCDYSIVLNWQGRNRKGGFAGNMLGTSSFSMVQYSPETKTKGRKQQEEQPPRIGTPMIFESSPNLDHNVRSREILNEYTDAGVEAIASPQFGQTPPHSAGLPPMRDFDPSLNRIRAQFAESYPSPAETNIDSPPASSFPTVRKRPFHHASSSDPMPPPFPSSSYQQLPSIPGLAGHSRQQSLEDHRSKRMHISPGTEVLDHFQAQQQSYNANSYFTAPNYMSRPKPPVLTQSKSYSPLYGAQRVPPTPAASSGSEDNHQNQVKPSPTYTGSPNNRRVSIQSLVSGISPAESPGEGGFQSRLSDVSSSITGKRTYGFDHGLPDLDIPNNKDEDVLSPYTPKTTPASPNVFGSSNLDFNLDENFPEFGFLLDLPTELQQQNEQEGKSYYSRIVKVEISRSLGPLPPELLNHQMNLLYFHHFVDHTARILVPYDCSENPFKTLLPKMALQDSTLLHLLLAYSAKHRSRLLKHAEPVKRIAGWMQDVFPALIAALSKPADQVSDSNLATAIMLASLEIISPAPDSDEIKVSWQKHLDVARQMMVARSQSSPVHRDGEVYHFLNRWFAYLDVLGSLSGGRNLPLFHGDYFQLESEKHSNIHQIDCLMGFTSRCVSILAHVAELAHTCDNQRIDPQGNVRPDWQPTPEIVGRAEEIKNDLYKARQHVQQGCHHRRNSTDLDPSYAIELVTTNDAFHWAGLIQLHRRVLGKPSNDPEVQFYVGEIVAALNKIRPGGTAEACLLFPMFTAGCDALPQNREPIMSRLKSVEKSGMFQVRQAISLVEKVWETGRSWETFIGEVEFIG